MLELHEARLGDARRQHARLDRGLRRAVDLVGLVAEQAERVVRHQLGVIGRVGELEERERAAVTDGEEGVAVGAFLAEQGLLLAPGRDQRQAEQVLVEVARRFQVAGHRRGMVQAAGQCGRGHRGFTSRADGAQAFKASSDSGCTCPPSTTMVWPVM